MGRSPEKDLRILAADIGGTHSRFGYFSLSPQGELAKRDTIWLPTAEAESFVDLLATLAKSAFSLALEAADAAVFAVPGAVVGRRVSFANIRWVLDLDAAEEAFSLKRAALINDFLAQAYGCRTEAGVTAEELLPGVQNPARNQAVIGAGTGLGKAVLVPLAGGGFTALASEGGQSAASFINPEEYVFAEFLKQATGENYVRGDSLLSGSGLAQLHRFLTDQDLSPAEVAASLTPDCPTTTWFARFYGRAARDYALTVLATGGVTICGGVAAKNPILVRHPEFAREFTDSPTYGGLLATIPVFLNRNEETGLYGAARFAQSLLEQPR